MKSKYIIADIGSCIVPIVFSELMAHNDMADSIRVTPERVLGAGFCYIENDRYVCYGRSISLGINSREKVDSDFLNRYLGVDQDY